MDDLRQADLLRLTIERFSSGESDQYELIRSRVSKYVEYRTRDRRIDRAELVDEILTHLYQSLRAGAFRGDSLTALSTYLYSIVRSRVSRAHHRIRRLAPEPDNPAVAGAGDEQAREQVQAADRILDPLAADCRKLMRLKFVEGWVNAEIADEAGKTRIAVGTQISRCLKKLREVSL